MKGALITGIDNYPGSAQLHGCVNDANALTLLLETNGDGHRNFEIELRNNVQTRAELRQLILKLFQSDLNTALFYFSGHGCITDRGGYIITPDFKNYDEGISMDELLTICNNSRIKEKIIILDCCHSGAFGSPAISGGLVSNLGEGITILTASGKSEQAMERGGHGLFTSHLLAALEGGAADIAGNVTAGGIYSYIDRSLGFWQQRPQFKTNVNRFLPLRTVQAAISAEEVLKKITTYFTDPEYNFPLDQSYEFTNKKIAIPAHVQVFKNLQKMQSVGLVVPVGEEHMYWAAQNSKSCKLTTLGKHYWGLVKEKRV